MKMILISMLLIFPVFAFAQGNSKPTLTLEDAQRIADAAEAKARQENWNVVIAILDDGGHLITLRRMDGVQLGSIDLAQTKAKTAVYYKRASKVFEEQVTQGNNRPLSMPNVFASEGGVPIIKDGVVIGAIGVSGVTSVQDGIIAAAGLSAF
jgi:glc operon protein GlcG